MRNARYTIAGGSASKVYRGAPRNPLFKILWDAKNGNPFSNKVRSIPPKGVRRGPGGGQEGVCSIPPKR
eukprot:8047201-Pyramimonas_sp.AAC.1